MSLLEISETKAFTKTKFIYIDNIFGRNSFLFVLHISFYVSTLLSSLKNRTTGLVVYICRLHSKFNLPFGRFKKKSVWALLSNCKIFEKLLPIL